MDGEIERKTLWVEQQRVRHLVQAIQKMLLENNEGESRKDRLHHSKIQCMVEYERETSVLLDQIACVLSQIGK